MQETQVLSLNWEDPLKKEMVSHSSILAWKRPWTEEPGGLQSLGSQRVKHHLATKYQQHWSPQDQEDELDCDDTCSLAELSRWCMAMLSGYTIPQYMTVIQVC